MEVQQLKTDQTNLQRLINIARPIDLPPLQATSPETVKPKVSLPLFGKRNTFKLSTTTIVKDPIITSSSSSDPMEVEEQDEPDVEKEKPNADEKPNTSADLAPRADVPILKPIEKQVDKIEQLSTDERLQSLDNDKETEDTADAAAIAKLSNAAKKRRNRIRLRGERGRENVDFDDSEDVIDAEKYSTWLPPENQSGDGSTNLNDKYGY